MLILEKVSKDKGNMIQGGKLYNGKRYYMQKNFNDDEKQWAADSGTAWTKKS